MRVLAVVAVIAVLAGVYTFRTYNRLVARRNAVRESWAGVDIQLTRRAALVPNLVATVNAYKLYERETTEAVVRAREDLDRAIGPAAAGEADRRLEGSLHQLFALSEAYPDLQASTNFLSLQAELARLEEDISFARRFYNANVRKYNDGTQHFPALLVAGPLGFAPAEYFRADADAAQAPRVVL